MMADHLAGALLPGPHHGRILRTRASILCRDLHSHNKNPWRQLAACLAHLGLFFSLVAALAAWWCLRIIWPKHTQQATRIAFLLPFYPSFKEQYIPVSFQSTFSAAGADFLLLWGNDPGNPQTSPALALRDTRLA
jgi:hypothetical protein